MKRITLPLAIAALGLFAGCGTYPGATAAVFDGGSQVQTRSHQTRAFDTTDRAKTLRAVVATLQDLGFIIEKADSTMGLVSATKLTVVRRQTLNVRTTVSVRPRGDTQLLVRMNAQCNVVELPKASRPIEDPAAYQDFFTALAQSMFLDAHEVE